MLKVIDDLLKPDDYEILRKTLMEDSSFQWEFANGVNTPGDGNYQFCHVFYHQFEPRSKFFYNLFPIINELEPVSIVRIKANLNMKTPERIEYEMHKDVDDCVTAIYYVNSNDGYTRFEDGTKVESVANRLVVFPSNIKHTGTTCTNNKARLVLNINYAPKNSAELTENDMAPFQIVEDIPDSAKVGLRDLPQKQENLATTK